MDSSLHLASGKALIRLLLFIWWIFRLFSPSQGCFCHEGLQQLAWQARLQLRAVSLSLKERDLLGPTDDGRTDAPVASVVMDHAVQVFYPSVNANLLKHVILCVCVCVCVCVARTHARTVTHSACVRACLSVCLSVSLSVCLSVCLFVCLSICVSLSLCLSHSYQ